MSSFLREWEAGQEAVQVVETMMMMTTMMAPMAMREMITMVWVIDP